MNFNGREGKGTNHKIIVFFHKICPEDNIGKMLLSKEIELKYTLSGNFLKPTI